MKSELENAGWPAADATGAPGMPVLADRATFQAELDALRVREKAHTREGDAIAADAPTTSAPPGAERIRSSSSTFLHGDPAGTTSRPACRR
jgi:hypothetical protein